MPFSIFPTEHPLELMQCNQNTAVHSMIGVLTAFLRNHEDRTHLLRVFFVQTQIPLVQKLARGSHKTVFYYYTMCAVSINHGLHRAVAALFSSWH
jgi:hypothetical protein